MSKSYRAKLKRQILFDTSPYSWCYEKFGPPFTKWHAIRYANYDIFSFKNQEDYALFLLTWGGNQ